MSRTFKDFMQGKNEFNEKKEYISTLDMAELEARNRFKKPYAELNEQEVSILIKILAGTLPYTW